MAYIKLLGAGIAIAGGGYLAFTSLCSQNVSDTLP